MSATVPLPVPDELLDEIARRAARLIDQHAELAREREAEKYLPPAAAARYLGVSRQRIYQLTRWIDRYRATAAAASAKAPARSTGGSWTPPRCRTSPRRCA